MLGALVVAAFILLAFRDVAFGGKTFDTSARVGGVNGGAPPTGVAVPTVTDLYRVDPGASAWQTVPWARVVHAELKKRELPLWNPYEGAGEPLAGNILTDVFDPLTLAINLHPTTLVWDVSFLLAFVLGGCAMYLFLRNLALSYPASVAGAIAFSLCGYFAIDSNNSFVRVYVYLPILFLSVDLVIQSRKLRWIALMGAAIGGTILAGMPESSFFVLSAGGLYAAYRFALADPGNRRWVAARMAIAGSVGLALAAPVVVAFLGYLPLTFNTHVVGVGSGVATRGMILHYLIPLVDGPPLAQRVAAVADRGWVGAAVGMLCVVALAAPRAMRRRGGWLFLAIGGALLLKVFGFPGVQWLGHLPLASRTNFVAFAPPVICFCLAAAAAIGIHALQAGQVRWPLLAGGVLAMGAAVIALALGTDRAFFQSPSPTAWRQYTLAGLAGGAVLVAAVASVASLRLRRPAALLAALAVVCEVVALFPQGIYLPRSDPFGAPAWMPLVTQAEAQAPASRVFGFDGLLFPDTAGALGLQDVRVLGALYPIRYITYVRDFISTSFTDRFVGDEVTVTDIAANPMFNLMGVRYLLAPGGKLDGVAGFHALGAGGVAEVYQNDQSLPRAFVANALLPVDSMAQAESKLKSMGAPQADGAVRVTGLDPAHQAVVEVTPGTAPPPVSPLPAGNPGRPVTIRSYAADRVVLTVPPGPAGLLVLTDTYLPGWHASVNGLPAATLPTDLAFRGVGIPAGASTVVFSYDPPHERLALLMPLVAVLGLLLVAVVMRRRGRGPRPARLDSPFPGHVPNQPDVQDQPRPQGVSNGQTP